MKEYDEIDCEILNLLQQNCITPTKEIAAKIGLSFTATYERIKRMEDKEIINKYVALVNRERLGYDLMVYCNVALKEHSQKKLIDFEKAAKELPEIIEIYGVSGSYDFMLKIIAKNISDYNNFVVNKISNLPCIGQYHSHFVMSEVKKETAIKVTK